MISCLPNWFQTRSTIHIPVAHLGSSAPTRDVTDPKIRLCSSADGISEPHKFEHRDRVADPAGSSFAILQDIRQVQGLLDQVSR